MSLGRWSWVIRIGFFNFIKRVRVLLIKYIKYQTVYLKKPDYERAKGTPQFLAALQLGRIVNSISSCQRTYLKVIDKGKLTQTKDQMEQLFTLASYVYEGVKEFFRREKDLAHLRAWRGHRAEIRFLKKESNRQINPTPEFGRRGGALLLYSEQMTGIKVQQRLAWNIPGKQLTIILRVVALRKPRENVAKI